MITNDERREIAANMRKNADDNVIFIGTIVADEIGTRFFKDAKCWNRLADLIEPDNIPDNADGNAHGLSGSCDRDALLKLADEMDHVGYNDWLYSGEWEPEEIARRIHEALGVES